MTPDSDAQSDIASEKTTHSDLIDIIKDQADIKDIISAEMIDDEGAIRKQFNDSVAYRFDGLRSKLLKIFVVLFFSVMFWKTIIASEAQQPWYTKINMVVMFFAVYVKTATIFTGAFFEQYREGYSLIVMLDRRSELIDSLRQNMEERTADTQMDAKEVTFAFLQFIANPDLYLPFPNNLFSNWCSWELMAINHMTKITLLLAAFGLYESLGQEVPSFWGLFHAVMYTLLGVLVEIIHAPMLGWHCGYNALAKAIRKHCTVTDCEKGDASQSAEDRLAEWIELIMIDEDASESVQERQRIGAKLLVKEIKLSDSISEI